MSPRVLPAAGRWRPVSDLLRVLTDRERTGCVLRRGSISLLAFCLAMPGGVLRAQEKHVPKVVPVPPLPQQMPVQPEVPVPEPTSPPARTVTDARTHVSFHLPAGWAMTRRDGEISTFRMDARTAPANSQVRAAASLDFNPFPHSTFSGALFYLTVAPHATAKSCADETRVKPQKTIPPATIDDIPFRRGVDEHGKQCTEARDVAYTTLRKGSCLRFDLVVNTFCGGEVSGAQDMSMEQLDNVFGRLEGILQTVKIGK